MKSSKRLKRYYNSENLRKELQQKKDKFRINKPKNSVNNFRNVSEFINSDYTSWKAFDVFILRIIWKRVIIRVYHDC